MPERIGDPEDDDEDEDGPALWLKNLSSEEREMRDAILRIVEDAKAHEQVDEIPDEKEEALKTLGKMFLASSFPYGNENGYNRVRFADVDEALTWFLLNEELRVKPVRKPADQLSSSPFSVQIHKEDYGFLDDHDGYGFRMTVYYACHNEEGIGVSPGIRPDPDDLIALKVVLWEDQLDRVPDEWRIGRFRHDYDAWKRFPPRRYDGMEYKVVRGNWTGSLRTTAVVRVRGSHSHSSSV